MEFGKDCSIVHLIDGKWVDSKLPWYLDMPKIQAFLWSDGDDCWLLLDDFAFRIGDEIILIKAGFFLDFTSIPRAFWTLIGHPLGVHKQIAGLIHDALYASNRKPQHASDDIFLGVLQACENNWLVRNECWVAVRSAGWTVYPKTEAERKQYEAMVFIIKL